MNWFRRLFSSSATPGGRREIIEAEGVTRDRGNLPEAERARELDRVPSDTHGDPASPLEPQVRAAARWRVAKALLALRDQVNQMAPNRDKSSDGTIGDEAHCGGGGDSDHCANINDGGVGRCYGDGHYP